MLAVVAAALGAAALVVLTEAPAALLAGVVQARTGGRVTLAEPSGTFWDGQADVVLSDEAAEAARAASVRTRVPGRTAWHIDAWRLLIGSLGITVTNPAALDNPFVLRADLGGNVTVEADHLRLPASLLVGLGAPWNTIRPGGEIALEWDTLHVRGGELRGRVQAEWSGASSGLSPVVPFGHYRLQADGIFDGAQVRLETLSGPMEMTGNGTIAPGRQLRFRGSAHVQAGTDPSVATQLSGLISLLGRRDGDGAILNFGS